MTTAQPDRDLAEVDDARRWQLDVPVREERREACAGGFLIGGAEEPAATFIATELAVADVRGERVHLAVAHEGAHFDSQSHHRLGDERVLVVRKAVRRIHALAAIRDARRDELLVDALDERRTGQGAGFAKRGEPSIAPPVA